MAHHLLPNIELEWIDQLTNCLLIRNPREMLASLLEFLPDPRIEDTGLPQQVHLFRRLTDARGIAPPVIDGCEVLEDPPRVLRLLCEAVGVPFDEAMLTWQSGPRDTDGAWAPYWYSKVYETTSFGKYRPRPPTFPRVSNHSHSSASPSTTNSPPTASNNQPPGNQPAGSSPRFPSASNHVTANER